MMSSSASRPLDDSNSWQLLGNPPPRALSEARRQIHWAAQIPSAAGRTFLEHRDDDSHTNLGWVPERQALATHPLAAAASRRAAIRPADLHLLVLASDNEITASLPLAGRTLNEGFDWLARQLADGDKPRALDRAGYDMPSHRVAEGGRFEVEAAAAAEIGRWYDYAASLLEPLAEEILEASAVRCWPHHFDIATLALFDPGSDPEHSPQLGIGLSPGDDNYSEPYWYVTPYPPPGDITLPSLEGPGHWRTEGWFGAILTGSEVVIGGSARQQAKRSDRFLRTAVAASKHLLRVA